MRHIQGSWVRWLLQVGLLALLAAALFGGWWQVLALASGGAALRAVADRGRSRSVIFAGLLLCAQLAALVTPLTAVKPAPGGPSAALRELTLRAGPERALAQLRDDVRDHPPLGEFAHTQAHAIGMAAYSRFANLADAWTHCSSDFDAGCYHGLVAAYLQALPTISHSALAAACALSVQLVTDNCLHGMGHGLLARGDYDLPLALGWCDFLETRNARRQCYDGVFMENVFLELDHQGVLDERVAVGTAAVRGLRLEDPYFPCRLLARPYQDTCYFEMPSSRKAFGERDPAALSQLCETLPEDLLRQCYYGLGREVASLAERDADKETQTCTVASRPGLCLAGVVRTYWGQPEKIAPLCGRAPGEMQTDCYAAMAVIGRLLYPEAEHRNAFCAGAVPAFVQACRQERP